MTKRICHYTPIGLCRRLLLGAYLAIAFSLLACEQATSENLHPIVVELFTSEGCSSCPPADALLKRIGSLAGDGVLLIPLSEHVDYWNYLGWRDPFSQHAFSERQNRYAQKFRLKSVYTPQMIVDGMFQFTGWDEAKAKEAIAHRKVKNDSTLSVTAVSNGSGIDVRVEHAQENSGRMLCVALVEDALRVPVRAGENAGKILNHQAVVRSLKRMDLSESVVQVDFPVEGKWKVNNLSVVAFEQDRLTLEIFAAGTAKVSLKANAI